MSKNEDRIRHWAQGKRRRDNCTYAPCGARVGRGLGREDELQPCSNEPDQVTCEGCKPVAEVERARRVVAAAERARGEIIKLADTLSDVSLDVARDQDFAALTRQHALALAESMHARGVRA